MQLPYPHPGTAGAEELRQLLGATPEFGSGRYAASFDRKRVNDPLPLAEPHTAAKAEQQCRDLLERQPARTGVASQVRRLLLCNPARPPTSDQVGASLFMTPRTLRRRLTEESSSYRALLDKVRQEVAVQLLHETRLSVAEVAERLGYSETASFTHAFRGWTGGSGEGASADHPTRARGTLAQSAEVRGPLAPGSSCLPLSNRRCCPVIGSSNSKDLASSCNGFE